VRAFFQPPIEGVVLQTYGAGNIPSNRNDLVEELKAASKRGILIVNCTQCIEGGVCSSYEAGMVGSNTHHFNYKVTCLNDFLPLGVASCCTSIQLVPYDAVNRNKVSIH
jgi:hypothetical protein